MNKNIPIAFSAAQPSGNMTLGNYIGAFRHWVNMQSTFNCIYCIVDLHALSTNTKNKNLSKYLMDTLAMYLACGIDPNTSIIFLQSHVPEHTQLFWLLNCYSYFGELHRMTQFKDKFINYKKHINVGIFNYPILMASDILLYQTNKVPIGKDQIQHLELTRKIAKRFNKLYGDVFIIPELIFSKIGSRIMSLLNLNKKMSKSDLNQGNVIFLLEDDNSITKKFRNAVTDSDKPPSIYYDPINKPGISNLLEILSCTSGIHLKELEPLFKDKTYHNLKDAVIESVLSTLRKLKNNYFLLRKDEIYLKNILKIGAEKARNQAMITLSKVNKAIGLL